jgi:mono/diheme cytochrome c family protein
MKTLMMTAALALAFPAYAQKPEDAQVKRGRYLIQVGGCNDCHTPAYPEKGGKVPEAQWLTGASTCRT